MAAGRGLRIGYEALSGGRFVRSFADAWKLVERAARPNLGLVIGTAHTHFAGASFSDLERIDPARIFLVHLADVPDIKMDSRLLSSNFRLFPGQGDLPLGAVSKSLGAMGYTGPVSLEIFNGQMRGMSPARIATDGIRSFNLLEEVDEASRDAIQDVSFVEIACFDEKRARLVEVLTSLGFVHTHDHHSKRVGLWRHGAVNVVLNEDPNGHAHSYHLLNGLSVCAMGYNIRGMDAWMKRLADYQGGRIEHSANPGDIDIPSIHGIDGGLIFFLDAEAKKPVYDIDFVPVAGARPPGEEGLKAVDHFSQAMAPAEFHMGVLFYRSLMGFGAGEQIGLIDPHGAIQSRNLRSANGGVRMAVNASFGPNSTTQRFLASRMGAGYQHFAFGCDDIFAFAEKVSPEIVLRIPGTYYDVLALRFDLDANLIDTMRRLNILYDQDANGRYFQLYTLDINGLFFEIVQREGGYAGFGAINAPVRMAAQTRSFDSEQNLLTGEIYE
jgi:4-hydroxyphenylpyruvate dioxygenase